MMHLLCAAVPFAVTGSAITEDGGRIDFDIPEGQIPDRTALADRINAWISENHPVSTRWITDEELDANPDLVRTMFVKPPRGTGKVRLVLIGEEGKVDLQPCGGTHVKATGEIGPIIVDKIQTRARSTAASAFCWPIPEGTHEQPRFNGLAGRTSQRHRHRHPRCLVAPSHCQAGRKGRISRCPHSGGALLRHRCHLGPQLHAAAHAATSGAVRERGKEARRRRWQEGDLLRQRRAVLRGPLLVDVQGDGAR